MVYRNRMEHTAEAIDKRITGVFELRFSALARFDTNQAIPVSINSDYFRLLFHGSFPQLIL